MKNILILAVIAADIFTDNPDLQAFHETSDGKAFYTANDAKNHAKTLTDKAVKLVERGAAATNDAPVKPPKAADAIALISAAATIEELAPFSDDTRATVKAAYDAKLAELGTSKGTEPNDQIPA